MNQQNEVLADQHGIRLIKSVNHYGTASYTIYIFAPNLAGTVVMYGIYTDLELATDAFNMILEKCDAPHKQDLLCVRLAGLDIRNVGHQQSANKR